jgi:hypothetical protein
MLMPPNPTVTIYFKGLLAFCFGVGNEYCQVGFHTKAMGHEVKVSVFKKHRNRIVNATPMLTLSHDMIRRSSDLWMDIEGATPKQQTAEPYIVNGQGALIDEDFRHVVDLEGENFYNRPLKIKGGILTPSLYLSSGLFYTAALTSHPYKTVSADATANSSRRIGRIATEVGANIYLDQAQALVLRAGGKEGPELFRLDHGEEVNYEITIDNGDNGLSPPSHPGNHFGWFYEAIELNAGESKILVAPNGGATTGDCIETWFSQSHRLGGNG